MYELLDKAVVLFSVKHVPMKHVPMKHVPMKHVKSSSSHLRGCEPTQLQISIRTDTTHMHEQQQPAVAGRQPPSPAQTH